METAWLEACLPERFTILGQTLEPFSIGHIMTLRRLNNVFVREAGRDAQRDGLEARATLATELGDLIEGIYVCCHTFEEGQAALQNPELQKILGDWGRQVGPFDLEDSCKWFRKYAAHACHWPEIRSADEKESEKRMPGAPFLQRVLLVLQGKLNFTRSEALNMPYAQALLEYFAYWEMEHAIKIVNDSEKAEEAELRAEEDRVWAEHLDREKSKVQSLKSKVQGPKSKVGRGLTAKSTDSTAKGGKRHAV